MKEIEIPNNYLKSLKIKPTIYPTAVTNDPQGSDPCVQVGCVHKQASSSSLSL